MRTYAIGDIHGHLDRLRAAHALIAADGGADAPVVHLGDLIDRGPDSRGVLALLIDAQARGRDWRAVMGNHDLQLWKFLHDPDWIDPGSADQHHWIERPHSGAVQTLASYGIPDAANRPRAEVHAEALARVPAGHARWLEALPLYLDDPGGWLFVHAGIRPGIALKDQRREDLTWIRREFHDSTADHGRLVVHGHQPVRQVTHYGNRLNVDTGAAHGGPVSAVRLEGDGVWLLTDDGARQVVPQ
ncbi:MAG: metallophosphoesterase [Paracoccus sp. (in: a-proteobacteria)]|nr:metallophosphoesterase [Paracoccus sp. (in: a-proteobacteria)]